MCASRAQSAVHPAFCSPCFLLSINMPWVNTVEWSLSLVEAFLRVRGWAKIGLMISSSFLFSHPPLGVFFSFTLPPFITAAPLRLYLPFAFPSFSLFPLSLAHTLSLCLAQMFSWNQRWWWWNAFAEWRVTAEQRTLCSQHITGEETPTLTSIGLNLWCSRWLL